MRSAWRMIVVLGLVSLLSGAVLAVFYGWMNPRIEAQRLKAQFEVGFKQVFPEAADFQPVEPEKPLPDAVEEPVYEALDAGGNVLGVVYNVMGQGSQGLVKLAVGLEPKEGQVAGVAVLEHTETAGLGSRIEEPSFRDQFRGKSVVDAFQVGKDVDGITGATVSSRAVANAVGRTAGDVLMALGYRLPRASRAPTPPADEAGASSEAAAAGPAPPLALAQELLGSEVELQGPVWEARDAAGAPVGLLAEASADGFDGPIRVLVAVDPQAGVVRGIRVVEQKETPGLGARVAEPEFAGQFAGKALDARFEVGTDIDGITGATISSKAVAGAVARAVRQITGLQGQDR
ncbi:FMN-binding protein [Limnochorda pilosa]|uniref:Ion-translocating oxidoreductase complex subunit G n=1 Tax=Limnochorda pilosa TaxID=1555112 RepID=A0A0K2SQ48_LIMPI|nr:FMN-binding protein [Limnochorda pilosa]BAS29245.1 electron transporter RnfG [Limnochorda pilosa]